MEKAIGTLWSATIPNTEEVEVKVSDPVDTQEENEATNVSKTNDEGVESTEVAETPTEVNTEVNTTEQEKTVWDVIDEMSENQEIKDAEEDFKKKIAEEVGAEAPDEKEKAITVDIEKEEEKAEEEAQEETKKRVEEIDEDVTAIKDEIEKEPSKKSATRLLIERKIEDLRTKAADATIEAEQAKKNEKLWRLKYESASADLVDMEVNSIRDPDPIVKYVSNLFNQINDWSETAEGKYKAFLMEQVAIKNGLSSGDLNKAISNFKKQREINEASVISSMWSWSRKAPPSISTQPRQTTSRTRVAPRRVFN